MKKDQKKRQAGGLKGFFERAGHSFWSGGEFLAETGTYLAGWAGKLGFIVATTAMVVFMPLVFELGREPLVRKSDAPWTITNDMIFLTLCYY
jgi:hypothetical protein